MTGHLTPSAVLEVVDLHRRGFSPTEIARRFKCTPRSIRRMLARQKNRPPSPSKVRQSWRGNLAKTHLLLCISSQMRRFGVQAIKRTVNGLFWGVNQVSGIRLATRLRHNVRGIGFFPKGSVNSEGYTKMLTKLLLPELKKAKKKITFQQDGAKIHTSNHTKAFFAKHKIFSRAWPANSPDMNPIENMWFLVNKEVQRACPEGEKQLKAAIRKSWRSISVETVNVLVASFAGRCATVISKNGEKCQR